MTHHTQVVVVGGGQAGLAAGTGPASATLIGVGRPARATSDEIVALLS